MQRGAFHGLSGEYLTINKSLVGEHILRCRREDCAILGILVDLAARRRLHSPSHFGGRVRDVAFDHPADLGRLSGRGQGPFIRCSHD